MAKFVECSVKCANDQVFYGNGSINIDLVAVISCDSKKVSDTEYPRISFSVAGGEDQYWTYKENQEVIRDSDYNRLLGKVEGIKEPAKQQDFDSLENDLMDYYYYAMDITDGGLSEENIHTYVEELKANQEGP